MTEPQKPNNSSQPPQSHKRRKRYSGTHPKAYSDKYKEQNISANPELRDKLRAKGKTPAGTHIPVLKDEIISCLGPKPGSIVADCTLGYGGHAKEFLQRIAPDGKLIGFDCDRSELARTKKRLSKYGPLISFYHSNFAGIAVPLSKEGLGGYDIIFADIGVSSMQIDNPERGISYKYDGPLDMRMDNRLPRTGADIINSISEEDLSEALIELSDEPDAEKISKIVAGSRIVKPITHTFQLMELILNVKGFTVKTWKAQQRKSKFGSLHPAARTFQTLRILVNDELSVLKQLLRLGPEVLNPGGRIGIISFHSGEDRIVKHAFRDGLKDGTYESISSSPIEPRLNEIRLNPRCASAKFRWAQKK